jgi:4-aminobutyrate aminotransferase-like enzyme/Ser/Thr protein kinase RdoA (MazF antagonist)
MIDAEADPLHAQPPAFSTEEACRIAEQVFAVTGSLSPLPSERDQNFRVDDGVRSFVLKISNPADDAAVVQMQTDALLHVARQDPSLPVMRVLPARDGTPWADVSGPDGRTSLVRLFTHLDGHNPEAAELDAKALRAWGATVARLGRALRGFFHPAAGYEILWDIKRAPALRPLLDHVMDPAKRDLVGQVLDRFDANVAPVIGGLRAQVIHNDMSLDNVLVDDRGRITGITDFGDMTHTALVCDLAVALADVLDGRPDALDLAPDMIAGYHAVTPLDDAEAAILGDLVAARAAAAIVISAWRLDLYPENAAYVSTFDDGAWRFLQLLAGIGFDQAGRLLREARDRTSLPYRAETTTELVGRRRRVLGSSPLSYHRPVHLVRGEGVWMFDREGRRYLDAYNNVPVVGHGHPRIAEAVASQIRAVNANTRYLHEAAVSLAERLLATMPPGFDRVLLVNSGSEANDVAWRIATAVTGGRGGIVSEYAYHGITEATAALSPEEWPEGERPSHVALVPAPDGYRGRYRREDPAWAERFAGHVGDAVAALTERGSLLAAMFVDPAFTSDGVLCPPPGYLRVAARAVREARGLLVADEVQAGHGRYGDHAWSFQAAGVEPDIVTLGKPMGNGYPVAAVVTRSELVDGFVTRTGFFSTFGGNPAACVAALTVMDLIQEDGLMANAHDVGVHLRGQLASLMGRHAWIGDVRGEGLMIGVELVRDRSTREPAGRAAATIVDGLRDRGVLIGSTGPAANVLKIRPPLVFRREHADLLVGVLDETLSSLGAEPGSEPP